MCSRPRYTDLTTMGGTGSFVKMSIIFSGVIKSWYASLNIKFSVNRMFHAPKIPVYRFDLCGRTLWTDEDNF